MQRKLVGTGVLDCPHNMFAPNKITFRIISQTHHKLHLPRLSFLSVSEESRGAAKLKDNKAEDAVSSFR